MAHLVTASLDDKTIAIWRALPRKSAWLRQALLREGDRLGISDREHLGTGYHRSPESGERIEKCNPLLKSGLCLTCYPSGFAEEDE